MDTRTNKTNNHKAAAPNLFARILQSSFLLVIVCLIAFDGFLYCIKPLQFIGMGGYIAADQNPLHNKYYALLGQDKPIDVLLLGSSLVMAASHNADAKKGLHTASTSAVEVSSYTGSAYLQRLLSQEANRNLSVLNFAAPSCMISDAFLILKNAINTGHKPATVILGVAPRDFIDNQCAAFGQSPYFSFYSKHSQSEGRSQLSLQDQLMDYLERGWHFFQIRSDYQVLTSLATTGYFHRAHDLYTATRAQKAGADFTLTWISPYKAENGDRAADEKTMSKSLAIYKLQYLPINANRYKIEQEHLSKIVQLCQEESIHLAIINLPLTKRNAELLPQDFKLQYKQDVRRICSKATIPFIDLSDDQSFKDYDFYDSSHTNGSGAVKIWEHAIRKLTKQGELATLLKTNSLASTSSAL